MKKGYTKKVLPFILAEFVVLFLVIYFPEITLFMPRVLGFIK